MCCCCGDWKAALAPRTNTNPLSPTLLAARVEPLSTATHAVEEPGAAVWCVGGCGVGEGGQGCEG